MTRDEAIAIGQRLESALVQALGEPVWVPGVANGAMATCLVAMAKAGLLSLAGLALLPEEDRP